MKQKPLILREIIREVDKRDCPGCKNPVPIDNPDSHYQICPICHKIIDVKEWEILEK